MSILVHSGVISSRNLYPGSCKNPGFPGSIPWHGHGIFWPSILLECEGVWVLMEKMFSLCIPFLYEAILGISLLHLLPIRFRICIINFREWYLHTNLFPFFRKLLQYWKFSVSWNNSSSSSPSGKIFDAHAWKHFDFTPIESCARGLEGYREQRVFFCGILSRSISGT